MTARDAQRLETLWRMLDNVYAQAAAIRDTTKNSNVHELADRISREALGTSREVAGRIEQWR